MSVSFDGVLAGVTSALHSSICLSFYVHRSFDHRREGEGREWEGGGACR